jgi:hypothetical protein
MDFIDDLPEEDLLKIVDGTYGDWISLIHGDDDDDELDDSVFEDESGYDDFEEYYFQYWDEFLEGRIYALEVLQEKTQEKYSMLGEEQIRKFSEIKCEKRFLSIRVEVLEEKVNNALKKRNHQRSRRK